MTSTSSESGETVGAAYAPDADGSDDLSRMSLGDHLDELRSRLVRSLIAIAVCMAVLLPFKRGVTDIYIAPYQQMWGQAFADFRSEQIPKIEAARVAAEAAGESLSAFKERQYEFLVHDGAKILDGTFDFRDAGAIENTGQFELPYTLAALGGISDFWVFMAATVLFGLLLASPVVLYQLWAFVAAGLYASEKRVVLRYFPLAVGLLIAGVSFGYFVVVPYGLYFLVRLMSPDQVVPLISVTQYFSMLLTMTGALGVCFQLPLVMLAIAKIGLVTPAAMRRNWRYVILGCFVLSAMFTPPDPFTQSMMAAPMVVLYLFGLVLTARATRETTPDGGATG